MLFTKAFQEQSLNQKSMFSNIYYIFNKNVSLKPQINIGSNMSKAISEWKLTYYVRCQGWKWKGNIDDSLKFKFPWG